MYLSEFEQKDVININNGANLGKICDVLIKNEGEIESFLVEHKSFFRRFFKTNSTVIEFKNMVKIGEDVILVQISSENE